MPTRSACYGLRYRFGAALTLRTADAPSACLTHVASTLISPNQNLTL
ncbi:MAG: hypothetical protein NZ455_01570 [Bacteroidia bacterium]|nr:hypothetical protein [Bacteroidia bacterium]MDW8347375.1 hypothetical protein [Bacteroidia bacterium]